MSMLWPGFLLLLGLIPLLIVVYLWMLRRRRRFAVRYSSLSLVRDALPKHSNVRRHLPFALFLGALASLVIAMTRPVDIVSIPTNQTTILLVMDVSRSMCSTDVKPTRLDAAEAAAQTFIQGQKAVTQIGIVAFSSFAEVVQAATTDRGALEAAVDSLTVGNRTAIGSAILKAIDAIAEIDQSVAPSSADPSSAAEPPAVPKGAYAPDIIVLLTDGASNTGILPVDAAQEAATRGIRVYTIGFGTPNGAEFAPCGRQFVGNEGLFGGPGGRGNGRQFGGGGGRPQSGGQGFGGGGGQGFGGRPGGFNRGIDEDTLKQVSAMTDGEYYAASSAGELQKVFQSLPVSLITKHEVTEISVLLVASGAILAALAIVLSMIWHPLP